MMKTLAVTLLFSMLFSCSVLAGIPAPMCDRVSVSFHSDNSGRVDSDKLRKAESRILQKLADHGYMAKYVTFYAPGMDIPPSNEAQIQADAGDEPHVLIEVSYTDELLTRNLALRIYKLEAKPPYHIYPYYEGNEQIGPVSLAGVNLKHRFQKLLNAKEMIDCAALSTMAAPVVTK